MLITIAWTETVSVWDGEAFAADLGRRPRFVEQIQPKACVWLLKGTEQDKKKAHDFVTQEYGSKGAVFTYEVNEPDPLTRAKKDILR